MTKILSKHLQEKNYSVILFIYSLDDLTDSDLGKLPFGGIVKSKIKFFFFNVKERSAQIGESLRI